MRATDQTCEPTSSREMDHDADWRERIQRALRDLRSISPNGAPSPQTRGDGH